MRILFSSWPAYGHLLPMLPMIRAAVVAGHEVRVASGADLTSLIRARGLTAEVAGPTRAADPSRSRGETWVAFTVSRRARRGTCPA